MTVELRCNMFYFYRMTSYRPQCPTLTRIHGASHLCFLGDHMCALSFVFVPEIGFCRGPKKHINLNVFQLCSLYLYRRFWVCLVCPYGFSVCWENHSCIVIFGFIVLNEGIKANWFWDCHILAAVQRGIKLAVLLHTSLEPRLFSKSCHGLK